jgi:CRISPR-associated endonuclease Cas2
MSNYGSIVADILTFLDEAKELIPYPFETPYAYRNRLLFGEYTQAVKRLHKRKMLRIYKKDDKKYICLTHQGHLETLLLKARVMNKQPWDHKWRLCVFDIPERAKRMRDQLRYLLKQNNFIKLQASVFISPNPINTAAIEYLQATNLIRYIRMLRVDRIDTDTDLRKRFKL